MTKKQYFVTHSAGCVHCDSISRELESGSFEELTYQDIVDRLNENEDLRRTVGKQQIEIECLSDELAQAKAVIDKRWNEYLEKKGDRV